MRSCRFPRCAARAEWARDPCCTAEDLALRRRLVAKLSPLLLPRASARLPAQIIAAAFLAQKFAAIDDHFAARNHRAGISFDLKTLKHRIIYAHVMRFRT